MITDITGRLKNNFPPESALEYVKQELDSISDILIIYKREDGVMAQVSSDMTHVTAIGMCEIGKQIIIEEMREFDE